MDNTNEDKKFEKELHAGIASLILLSVMKLAEKPMYGYQIAKLIEADRDNVTLIKQGTLYPVLRSLENSGLLESEVEPSISGPPRRYYRITNSGRETLVRWTETWDQTKNFVDSILKGVGND
ncbi:MAG: PadR family transcriptional regulator [Chloroflexi bacterium]|nr:PadR family transcriptional regulator [Chloroflexota bacterium]